MSRTLFFMLARQYLKLLLMLLGAVLAIYIIVDFGERLRLYNDKSWSFIIALYASKSVVLAHQLCPAAMLLAAAVMVSTLRRTSEWTAMQSVGISQLQVLSPLVAVLLMLAALMSAFDDRWVTWAHQRLAVLEADRHQAWGSDGRFFFSAVQWFRVGPYFVHLRGRKAAADSLDEVTVYQVDANFQVVQRIDAEQLRHVAGEVWKLVNVKKRQLSAPQHYEVLASVELTLPKTSAASFGVQLGRPESMTVSELRDQIRIRRKNNLPVLAYWWAIHQRFSYPLLGVAAALVAAMVALRVRRNNSMTTALAEGLVLLLGVFLLLVASKALAMGQHLSPGQAAWAPPLLIVAALLGFISRAQRAW